MILLAATLVAILVGTAYYAGTGFWKKPRLAMVTFVSLFAPAVFFLPFSGWEPPLIGWSSGWAYLVLVYLAVHLAGLLAYFWALVEERLVHLFHKLKVGLLIFLGIAAAWFVFMYDEPPLQIAVGLIPIAIVVFGGLWLFRVLRERKDSNTASARLKNLLKNVRGRVNMKVRTKNGRPRFSLGVILENLRSRIPWRISIGNIIPLLCRLFSVKKWFARLCRDIRARFSRSDKSKTPPPPS